MPPSLDACLKQSGVKLSREHRAFLRDHPTSLPVDDDHPPPPRAGARATPGSAPAWAKDVSVLFGANDFIKQLTQKKDDIGFWDRRLNRFAVAIGRCFDGDVLVQVSGGRHAGHILRTNHDEYYGLFEHLPKLGGSRLPPALVDRMMPVLRRLRYRSGAPTCDQVVGALLHDDLEGAEPIARSFDELYQALLRAFRPQKPPGRDVRVTRLDQSPQVFATTAERTYILGARIVRGATWRYRVLRVRPAGKPKPGASAEGYWSRNPTMIAVGNRVLFAVGDALYVSTNEGPAKELRIGPRSSRLRTDITGVGADGNGGAWVLARAVTSKPDPERSWPDETYVLRLFWSKDGVRFVAVRWPHDPDDDATIVGTSSRGLLVATSDRLYLLGPKRTIRQLGRPERNNSIVAATITNTGTLLAKLWLGATRLRRSTTGGRMWRRLEVNDREIHTVHCTATGTVVLGGKKLWISRDDGETFAPLPVRLRAVVDALADAGGELLVGAGDLYRLPVGQRRHDCGR